MGLWAWLFHRRQIDRDLDDEIQSHLAMATRDRVADGEAAGDARLAAMKDLGNVVKTAEATRRVWRGNVIEMVVDLWQDVRFGLRMLVKNPGFSLVVVGVLTLGIGGNALVFSVFKGLALEPLPGVRDSGGVTVVLGRSSQGRTVPISYPEYRYFLEHNDSFVDLIATNSLPFSLGLGSSVERVWAETVSGNYFQALGVRAQLGRTLLPSDDAAVDKPPVVVLSDGLWRRTFGADPAIVGKTIRLNASSFTVVGVVEPEFQGTIVSLSMDLYVPLTQPLVFAKERLENWDARSFIVMGWPRPGVSRQAASAQIEVQSAQLDAEHPVGNVVYRSRVIPIWQSPYGAQTYLLPVVSIMGVMGVLLLMVVCANVANLVLVRGATRRGEVVVRLALGASRARILRLLFIENLVLAVPGALLGVVLARTVVPFLASSAAAAAPTRVNLNAWTDGWVIGFSLVLSCASALVFGFVPALRTSKVELAEVVKDESPRNASRGRLRSALVVAQVAVSVLLLVAASLVARSLAAAQDADAGFNPRNVSAVTIDLQPNGYDAKSGQAFLTRLVDELGAEPGIEAVSVATYLPLTLVPTSSRTVAIEGYQPPANEDLSFMFNVVGADYFRTMRIAVLAGREFERRDDNDSMLVAMVNETFARRLWQTPEAAIGKRVKIGQRDWRTIVGVARDLKYATLNEDPRPYVYLPIAQNYNASFTIHAKGRDASVNVVGIVRRHVRSQDPDLPLLLSKMLAEQTRVALSAYEMAAGTLTVFGVMTILLSALGIYGLVAFTVQQSTQEIGIRLAIGASRRDVVRQFFTRGVTLSAIGIVLGLAGSLAATRFLALALYGVGALDAPSFAGATLLVTAIALTASVIPALRASRTDPLVALRRN